MRLKTWPLILILSLGLGFAGCGGDDDDDNNNPPPGTTGTISGVVSDLTGSVMSDVAVRVGAGTPVQTNEQGYFVLSGVAVGNVVVTFAAPDYVSTYRNVTVLANQTTHLPEVGLMSAITEVVDGTAGGTLDAGVGGVTFPANAFVDEAGNPYTGDVTVEMAALAPQMAGFYAAFPGEFEGMRENGDVVPFVSFGIMDVNLMNADKSAPVRLAPGVTAELTMSIPTSLKADPPTTMPMWYYDPATGRWIEDGEATLDGNNYVADVDHFTTWNWDVPLEDICLIQGTVLDANDNPVVDARVISQGVQSGLMDQGYTDASGHYSVRGIADETFRIRAIKGSYASPATAVVLSECPFTVDTALELLEPAFSITLTWGEAPGDLDSHLWVPQPAPAAAFHVYYSNMGSLTDDPFTLLDTDDTSSFGPEIISAFNLYNGTYEYYVHNYDGNDEGPLKESGAIVNLLIGNQSRTYAVANVPGADTVEWWHVFDIVVGGGQGTAIVDVMTFEVPSGEGELQKMHLPAKH